MFKATHDFITDEVNKKKSFTEIKTLRNHEFTQYINKAGLLSLINYGSTNVLTLISVVYQSMSLNVKEDIDHSFLPQKLQSSFFELLRTPS